MSETPNSDDARRIKQLVQLQYFNYYAKEAREVLKDPEIKEVLSSIKANPQTYQEIMNDPEQVDLQKKLNVLKRHGIIRVPLSQKDLEKAEPLLRKIQEDPSIITE